MLSASRVEPPDGSIQHGREEHPEQIRYEERPGQTFDASEGDERGEHGQVEHDAFGEGQSGPVQAEEERRPERIQRPLSQIEAERPPLDAPASLASNQPGGQGHHDVQRRPYRTE